MRRLTRECDCCGVHRPDLVRGLGQHIVADLESGAPRNADGTINLMHFAAWLVRGMGNHVD